jgi:PP-loop superfamily ATP-utilizing enzyme
MGRPTKSENSKKPLKSFKRQSEEVRVEAAELREEVLEKADLACLMQRVFSKYVPRSR